MDHETNPAFRSRSLVRSRIGAFRASDAGSKPAGSILTLGRLKMVSPPVSAGGVHRSAGIDLWLAPQRLDAEDEHDPGVDFVRVRGTRIDRQEVAVGLTRNDARGALERREARL